MCFFCTLKKHRYNTTGKYLFALGLRITDPLLTYAYRPRKEALLGDLAGTILETGPGSGLNFKYYAPGSTVIAVEPNRYLHPCLEKAATRNNLSLRLHDFPGESMALPDGIADAAVISLVLCSVVNPGKVVSEIHRVLKPGGRFVFIEHVAAPENTHLYKFQKLIEPVWQRLFDGCHPDRDSRREIESAGFRETRVDEFRLSVPVVAPHISGVAVK